MIDWKYSDLVLSEIDKLRCPNVPGTGATSIVSITGGRKECTVAAELNSAVQQKRDNIFHGRLLFCQ